MIGYIKSYIILPSTIYSLAKTKLVELGVQNPRSQQVPQLIRAGIRRGQAGVVGKGENVWPNVHIDDSESLNPYSCGYNSEKKMDVVADLFIVVYENALSGMAAHGREGYYFGENGEHKLVDVAKEVGKVLHEIGKSKTAELVEFTDEDYKRSGNEAVSSAFVHLAG